MPVDCRIARAIALAIVTALPYAAFDTSASGKKDAVTGDRPLASEAAIAANPDNISVPPATHVLIDRIWDARQHRFVDEASLLRVLRGTDFVLLGEIHDNADQHRRQSSILAALIAAGRRPALAMEQLDRENQSALDAAIGTGDAEAVATAGRFDRQNWRWPQYKPLVETAVAAKLPLVAVNLSRRVTREVGTQGFARLGADQAALKLDEVWTPARQQTLTDDLLDAHCGALSRDVATAMALGQRARDATIADTLLSYRANGAVLIAGAGHARRDLGVPLYLNARAADASVVAIAFTEVRDGLVDPATYEERPAAGATEPAFDYLWFTARAERADPCAEFVPPASKSAPTEHGAGKR